MSSEIWAPIPGCSRYEVSDEGRVRKVVGKKLSYQTMKDIRDELQADDCPLTRKRILSKYNVSNSLLTMLKKETIKLNENPYKIIKPQKSGREYYYVDIFTDDKIYKRCCVHRLVMEAFVGPLPSENHVANHIDGNKENNSLANLEYVTKRENTIKYHESVNTRRTYAKKQFESIKHTLTSENEEWKSVVIEGFDHYIVSNRGQVKRISNVAKTTNRLPEKPLKWAIDKDGYPRVMLRAGKKKSRFVPVHRLVIESFFRVRNEDEQINHIDGNKKNANIENLEFVTPSSNRLHALNTGLVSLGSHNKKLTEEDVINIKKEYFENDVLTPVLAKKYGVTAPTISAILNGKTYSYIK